MEIVGDGEEHQR